jgi:hypothetical protein
MSPDPEAGGEARPAPPTRSPLDRLEQLSKIFATALIPVIVALGGWWIQSTVEKDKQRAADLAAEQQRATDLQKVSLEYVKLAKEILASEKPPPKELTKWSWGLIDQMSPRKFDPEDLKNVIANDVRILPPPAPLERAPQSTPAKPSSLDGFVISVLRARTERRQGSTFSRTVGYYHVFFKGQKLPDLEGMTVERPGPGDNTVVGQQARSRLAAGIYPLYTHAGASRKYATYGYDDSLSPTAMRPAIRIEDTGVRAGVLIHPAQGYLWSIGTINLSGPLADASADIEYKDSAQRVIALIEAMKGKLGKDYPPSNNRIIPNAWLVIAGEPPDVVAPQDVDVEVTSDANP